MGVTVSSGGTAALVVSRPPNVALIQLKSMYLIVIVFSIWLLQLNRQTVEKGRAKSTERVSNMN